MVKSKNAKPFRYNILNFSMVRTMLQISQEKFNLTYHPILDNYEQFSMIPKITTNNSNFLFGRAIEYGKKTLFK